ncbi:MAG: hypothetical protein JXA33_25660 [Anaerolineae bacterium]|nr:hypothetical protein [Anaerolineae bacterium]
MTHDYSSRLAHVFWMGGSPCAGKSTWADRLAKWYSVPPGNGAPLRNGVAVYHVDDAFRRHLKYFTPEAQPTLYHWTHTPWEDLWMQSDEALLEQAIAAYTEHFSLIVQDLLETDPTVPLLAEGTALLPDCVAPLLVNQGNAIWIVPSEDFQRQQYAQRNFAQGILSTCRNPDQAFQNWMNRDANFARWVVARARVLGLHLFVNDGSRSVEVNVAQIADYFHLRQSI